MKVGFNLPVALSLVFSLGAVAGCDLKKPGPVPGATPGSPRGSVASFFVLPRPPGTAFVPESARPRGQWAFPAKAVINLVACVQDVGRRDIVIDHRFEIRGPTRTWIRKTDGQGCLFWDEEFEPRFLADPYYIETIYYVRALGVHRGTFPLRLALNPWVPGRNLAVPPVRDLEREFVDVVVPEARRAEALAGTYRHPGREPFTPHVILDPLNVHFLQSFPGRERSWLEVEVQGQARLALRDTSGQPQYVPIPQGRLEAQALLATADRAAGTGDGRFHLLTGDRGPLPQTSLVIEDQIVRGRLKIPLRQWPREGQLELFLNVEPQAGSRPPDGLGAREARYILGDARDFNQTYAARLQTEADTGPRLMALSASASPDPGRFRDVGGYFFRPLAVRSGGVVTARESNTERTARLLITACVQDPLLFRPVRLRPFAISARPTQPLRVFPLDDHALSAAPPEKTFERQDTDPEGCLRFSDHVTFPWYGTTEFMVRTYVFEDVLSQARTVLHVVVNPWDGGPLFARDAREFNAEELQENRRAPPPQIVIPNYVLTARGTDYELDRFLRLKVVKKFVMALNPRVLRHDSISQGREGEQKLRDGLYRLRLALVKGTGDGRVRPEQFVNAWSKVVEVKGGGIQVPVEFSVRDLTLMGSRARLIIEIQPINENKVVYRSPPNPLDRFSAIDQQATLRQADVVAVNSGLESPPFAGPFLPFQEGQSAVLEPHRAPTVDEILAAGTAAQERGENEFLNQARAENFDRRNRLRRLSLADADDLSWLARGFGQPAETVGRSLTSALREGAATPGEDRRLGEAFCTLWARQFVPEALAWGRAEGDTAARSPQVAAALALRLETACKRAYDQDRPFFRFERYLHIDEIDPSSVTYMGGVSFNYNVMANFIMNKNESWDVRKSHSSDVAFSGGIGFEGPFYEFGMGRTEVYSSSESDGYMMSRGAVFMYGAGAYLVIQHSQFRFRPRSFERCMVVRPSAELMRAALHLRLVAGPTPERPSSLPRIPFLVPRELADDRDRARIRDTLSDDTQMDLLESGLRVCSGVLSRDPVSAVEDFFYVTQHFTTGDLHDPADQRNRPYLLLIRGQRDFRVFIAAIHRQNTLSRLGSTRALLPMDILAEAYSDYNARPPSWPGFYALTRYNPFRRENCERTRSPVEDLLGAVREVAIGPATFQDGRSLFFRRDFWEVFYCPKALEEE